MVSHDNIKYIVDGEDVHKYKLFIISVVVACTELFACEFMKSNKIENFAVFFVYTERWSISFF